MAIGGALIRFGDDNQPIAILQRIESLAAERMTLDETDFDGLRPRLAVEQTDDGLSAFGKRVDARQIVKAFGIALVDRIVMRARCLDHFAKARKTAAGERIDSEP